MKTTLSIAILATLSLPIQAETRLQPVITASRIAQTADQTMTAVTVINQQDITNSQSQSLPELLRMRVPGLDFSTTGGIGHQTSTFLRGANSDHVIVMVDGVIIGSVTTGATPLELIPLQQIERIEIVRGPRSALYGAEAIGGVIQIFTRKSANQSASVTLGGQNTRIATAGFGMHNDSGSVSLSASHLSTDGFNVTNDNENDDDGHTNNAVTLNGSLQVGGSSRIYFGALQSQGDTEFDNNSFDNVSDHKQQSIHAGFTTALTDNWDTDLKIARSLDRLETNLNTEDFFNPGTFNNEQTLFETRREQLLLQNQLVLSDGATLSFGFDYLNDKVNSTTSYAETGRNNKGIYALVQSKFNLHEVQAAVRSDDNEAFGRKNTGSLAYAYDLNGNVRTTLSYGTAFKAPNFNELYFTSAFFNGNPNLKPESSRTWEWAVTSHTANGMLDARVYRTSIDDLIVTNTTFTSVDNIDKATIKGMEVDYSIQLDNTALGLNASLIDPVDDATGLTLQNRAKQTIKLRVDRQMGKHRFGLSVLRQSGRYADSANTTYLGGYTLINARVAYTIDKHWRITSRLENVTDVHYSTTTDFFGNTTNNTPRTFFLGVNYQH